MAYAMLVDLDRCIGCWTCSMACKVGNHLADDEYRITIETHGSGKGIDRPSGTYPQLSMTWQPKYLPDCTFCATRISERQGPFCVNACPTYALAFGDDADPTSAYSQAHDRLAARGARFDTLPNAGEATRACVQYATARPCTRAIGV